MSFFFDWTLWPVGSWFPEPRMEPPRCLGRQSLKLLGKVPPIFTCAVLGIRCIHMTGAITSTHLQSKLKLRSLSTNSSLLSPPVSSVFLDLTARCCIWVKPHSALSFYVLLISLSILSSRFLHDVACVRTSFWVWISSIVWLAPFCLIHQLMDT